MLSPLFMLIPILLPILGGFLVLPLHFTKDRRRNVYTMAVVLLTSAAVLCMLLWGSRDPVDIYRFTDGFSISFHLDGPAMVFAGLLAVLWPPVMLYAYAYMRHDSRKNLFFSFFVMTYGIALGVALSADMITLYVFFEMLTLVTLPLVTHYENHESMYAGRHYAAYTIGGASLAFFAVVLTTVWGQAGSFIYGGSLAEGDGRMLYMAFLFGFFGFGTKAALFPFHAWLPTASAAPTPVTALLHAVAVVNSGVFAVMRMIYYVFGTNYLVGTKAAAVALGVCILSLLFGAVMAVRERHFKRRLAYSTMSNLSYMLFAFLLLTPQGLAAGLAHMCFHSVIKMLLFLCCGAFMHRTGQNYIYELSGVGKRMPVTFACFALGAVSLVGVPPMCGFISKWLLIKAGAEQGTVLGLVGAGALILTAFLTAVYCLSIPVRAFFPTQGKDRYAAAWPAATVEERADEALMLIPILFFAALNVLLGLFSAPLTEFLQRIAQGGV